MMNKKTVGFAIILIIATVMFSNLVYSVGWNQTAYNTTYLPFEDTPYSHNFTVNVTNPEPGMTFKILETEGPDGKRVRWNGTTVNYTTIENWIYFINLIGADESSDGLFLLNATRDNETGNFSLPLFVSAGGAEAGYIHFNFNITPVNDAPLFSNLTNKSFNRSELFEYYLNITDEESNTPYFLNITFLSCSVAQWSTRNCSGSYGNLTLFNASHYTFANGTQSAAYLNISFTPERNDVGNYTINFTITDSGNTSLPHNASRSQVVNFEVKNINEFPYFTFVCDADQNVNATEDTEFTCYINATDIDEYSYLNFSANYSWFNFSESGNSSVQISDQENFTTLVRINGTDTNVGNWVINISVNDTGSPRRVNSTILYFNISNTNDSVSLVNISNKTAHTSDNETYIINATDNDLLIPDTSVYQENLTFTSNNSNVVVSNIVYVTGTNRTNATLSVYTAALGSGVHAINITAYDKGNWSSSSRIFTINVSNNTAPEWAAVNNLLNLTENQNFVYNFSKNVSDDDGDSMNFSYTINNNPPYTFPQFNSSSFNLTTGVLSITPIDIDVGYHNVTVIVTDSKGSSASQIFNITVNNVHDSPTIIGIGSVVGENVSVNDSASLIVAQEDNFTIVYLYAEDNDFFIQQDSEFYDENLTLTTNITSSPVGTTITSFNFVPQTTAGEQPTADDQTLFYSFGLSGFIPVKADVGNYTMILNLTDNTNRSVTRQVNMTINPVAHRPVITDLANQEVSILNETLYINVNATDVEDGNDTTSTNFTFTLTPLNSGSFLTINSTTGVMNFTFNSSHAGLWRYNLTVNDSDGDIDYDLFNVSVYDYPQILLPNSTYQYSLKENQSYQLNFSVNHTVQDNLTYSLIINNITRNTTSGYGNSSAFLWNFTSNFTDETTCSGAINLTLNVSNSKLSNSTYWSVAVNHTNYPLAFTTNVSDSEVEGGSPQNITLSGKFADLDASDLCVNQTIGFTYTLVPGSDSGTITVTFINWTNGTTPRVSFGSSDDNATGNYSITAIEYNSSNSSQAINNATSNNFTVSLNTESDEDPTPTPTSGGGGSGGSGSQIISLKIIVPGPVSAKQKDRIVVPISLLNDGAVTLKGITLSAYVAKDGILRNDLLASFDRSSFEILRPGQQEDLTMIVDIDTSATGLFEVTINATVVDPKYSDWAKFFIQIEEEIDILERIVFTEEFIIGNPQCAEFADLIEEAKDLYEAGRPDAANIKTEEALDACKTAITQEPRARIYQRIGDKFFTYAAVASLGAFVLGFAYYSYRKIKLRRQVYGSSTYQGKL